MQKPLDQAKIGKGQDICITTAIIMLEVSIYHSKDYQQPTFVTCPTRSPCTPLDWFGPLIRYPNHKYYYVQDPKKA